MDTTNKTFDTLDLINAVGKEMDNATSELRATPQERFNLGLLKLIQDEIAKAKPLASKHRYLYPGSKEYVYQAPFCLAIFECIPAEVLTQLAKKGVHLHSTKRKDAKIQIVFRF